MRVRGVPLTPRSGSAIPPGPPTRPRAGTPAGPGTINLVVQVPVALDPGAAVNAAVTATEAKVQGVGGPRRAGNRHRHRCDHRRLPREGPPERFAGPRSRWGSRIAQAVYRAVWAGAEPGA